MRHEDKYKQYAKKVKLFNGLHPDEVEEILKRGRILDYHEGKTIFHEGQLGSNIFVVFHGKVDIFNHNELIAKCRVGDAFGEMSALNHSPHQGTAVAASPVRLFVLTEKEVNEILEKRVAVRFLLNIIHILSGHLERTNTRNAQLRSEIKQTERQPHATPAP